MFNRKLEFVDYLMLGLGAFFAIAALFAAWDLFFG